MMERYLNLGGDSNIAYYEIGPDYINVMFYGGVTYVYTYKSAGRYHVDNMKSLATQGSGLNSYIMGNCKNSYERKY